MPRPKALGQTASGNVSPEYVTQVLAECFEGKPLGCRALLLTDEAGHGLHRARIPSIRLQFTLIPSSDRQVTFSRTLKG